MELINKDTPQVKEFISSLDSMLNGIETIVKHYKPCLFLIYLDTFFVYKRNQ